MFSPWKEKNTAITTGAAAERLAEKFLHKQGLKTLKNNYRCKMGEIDLIMQHGNDLVFVEIRYRSRLDFGTAIETVTARKQQKLIKTAQYFLQQHPQHQKQACRFDVIGISGALEKYCDKDLEWIRNAFTN